jgi:hypothetical protein
MEYFSVEHKKMEKLGVSAPILGGRPATLMGPIASQSCMDPRDTLSSNYQPLVEKSIFYGRLIFFSQGLKGPLYT